MAEVAAAVARYAGRLHRVAGEGHHVASPLGAWLLLALCGPASRGDTRAELAEVVGCELDEAAAVARVLLSVPHPQLAAAAGVWWRAGASTGRLARWLAGLPPGAETGQLAGQAALDDWADRSTGGMISKFPVDLPPQVLLVLATALAARISWQAPFDVVPGTALGPHSRWASQLPQVLRTPRGGWGHEQFIATTAGAGDVAVHCATAADGELLVTSVAAQPGVPAAGVLAAGYRLATALACGSHIERPSLFDLPLGAAPLWEITEQPAPVESPGGREQNFTAVLPAWSADSRHDLAGDPGLGFSAAAATLASLLNEDTWVYQARQAATARYSRTGFAAAAITGAWAALGGHVTRPGLLRTAELRFGQPFAVIAVTAERDPYHRRDPVQRSPWHGLPVFSAWITQPENADDLA
jgi:hypothetical protein